MDHWHEEGPGPRAYAGAMDRDLASLAARLRTAPPSCGPVRLIAVDGHAGSGKSTFAGRLAEELGGAPVVHTDDLATHEELFAWSERFGAQILAPLSRGETARYSVYDWVRGAFTEERALAPAPLVLVEGVGAGRMGAAAVSGVPAVDGTGERTLLGKGSTPGRTRALRVLEWLDSGGARALRSGSFAPLRRFPGAPGADGIRGGRGTFRNTLNGPAFHAP